jgi:hypothetical protein
MARGMDAKRLAFVQGMDATRTTLSDWNRSPGSVLGPWVGWSVAVSVALLGAVWVIASVVTPDPTPLLVPGVNTAGSLGDAAHLFGRNLLVLALHAMACVAGFMAGSSLPQVAEGQTGVSRWVHEKAGPLAIGFVVCATAFSLATQAWALGNAAATISSHFGLTPAQLLVCLLPHALPELTALFLPLAAWVIASRQKRWHELLAATVLTVAIALPVLALASLVEIYVSPILINAAAGF